MAGRFRAFIGMCAAVLVFLPGGGAVAASQPKAAQSVSVKPAPEPQALQPAMWKIVNGKSTVYLLGSIHILPVNYTWRTPAIDKAIAAADVLIFETNVDFATAEFHYYMDRQGYLPR